MRDLGIKVIVYSCITGDYEEPIQNHNLNNEIDYIFFVEDHFSKFIHKWEKSFITDSTKISYKTEYDILENFHHKEKNRFIKMHPHLFLPPHDLSIYIDGNIEVLSDLRVLIEKVMESEGNIFLYQHPLRNCIYDEALACVETANEYIWRISRQMKRYRTEGFPENQGLFEGNVIVRKNDTQVKELMKFWWEEYKNGAKRDQLSLVYCSYKLKIPINSLGLSNVRSDNVDFFLDLSKRERKIKLENHLVRFSNAFLSKIIKKNTIIGH